MPQTPYDWLSSCMLANCNLAQAADNFGWESVCLPEKISTLCEVIWGMTTGSCLECPWLALDRGTENRSGSKVLGGL